jgi:hypothetical protein
MIWRYLSLSFLWTAVRSLWPPRRNWLVHLPALLSLYITLGEWLHVRGGGFLRRTKLDFQTLPTFWLVLPYVPDWELKVPRLFLIVYRQLPY